MEIIITFFILVIGVALAVFQMVLGAILLVIAFVWALIAGALGIE